MTSFVLQPIQLIFANHLRITRDFYVFSRGGNPLPPCDSLKIKKHKIFKLASWNCILQNPFIYIKKDRGFDSDPSESSSSEDERKSDEDEDMLDKTLVSNKTKSSIRIKNEITQTFPMIIGK